MNLKNCNLDSIQESTKGVDFMYSWSVLGFVQKNAKSVFGFGIPDLHFPPKNAALNTGRTKCGGGGEGAFWLGFEMTLLTYVKLLTFASSMSTKLIFGSKDVVFEASCQTEGLRHLWEFFFHLQVTVVCARREQSSANRASLISWCRHFIFAFRRWKFF